LLNYHVNREKVRRYWYLHCQI